MGRHPPIGEAERNSNEKVRSPSRSGRTTYSHSFYYNFYYSRGTLSLLKVRKANETLVDLRGFEPLTPWLQTRCSPN